MRDTPAGTQLGTQLIVPLERDDGDAILVDRGWVPDKRPRPIAQVEGDVTMEGYVRPSETPGMFSATDNPATRQFYTLDAPAIGAALGAGPGSAVLPGGDGAAATGTLSRSGAPSATPARTTICPMRSPGMASPSLSW